jgi:hypothetical protein
VEVRHEDTGVLETDELIRGDEVALDVVVAGQVGEEHRQAVADRDARGDDEERVREAAVLRVGELVERVPRDEHRHNHGLARPCRHLVGDPVQAGVLPLVLLAEAVLDPRLGPAGDLGEEDRRLEGLDLAEEQRIRPVGRGPVLEELAGDGGHPRAAAPAPHLELLADPVDEVVGGEPLGRPALAGEGQLGGRPLLFGLGDRDEERARAATLADRARDAVIIEREVARRHPVRRVEDRVLDDVSHPSLLCPRVACPASQHTEACVRLRGTGEISATPQAQLLECVVGPCHLRPGYEPTTKANIRRLRYGAAGPTLREHALPDG